MSPSNYFRTLLLFWAVPGPAQQVEVIPDIAFAEAQYHDASEAWLRNDPNLERDLFKADPVQVRRRIRQAASLRDDAMVKKEVYLKAEIQRWQRLRDRLSEDRNGAIPTEADRKSLREQQAHKLAEQRSVEEKLRDLPEADEYLPQRRALDEERTHLINLQNNIAERVALLDSIDTLQQSIQSTSAGESLAQKLDEIVKLWEQERDNASRQRAHWAQLYTAMEQAVNKRSPVPNVPKKGSSKKSSRPAAPAQSSPPPSASAGGVAGGPLTSCSRPGVWSLPREQGSLAVCGGFHDVGLAFAGLRQSAEGEI